MFSLILALVVTAFADEPARMIPDPAWVPKPGDHATVFAENAPGCINWRSYDLLTKALEAKDDIGIKQSRMVTIPKGTEVLVIKPYRPAPAPEQSQVFYSGGSFASAAIQSILSSPVETKKAWSEYPIEVRLLDGPMAGQIKFIPEEVVGQMIPEPKSNVPAKKAKPIPKPIDPAVRAATMLRSGQSLERAKKTAGAITIYKQLAKDFPETEAGKAAADRIHALSPAARK